MMKYIILYSSLFCFLFLGCLKDEGNYNYKDVVSPTWLGELISVSGYIGEMMKFQGHKWYRWEKDSALREKDLRFEWKVNGFVISDKADFEIATDSLVKLFGENPFSEDGFAGTFSIIDETEIPYMIRVGVFLKSSFNTGDWVILSQSGDHSKYSFIRHRQFRTGWVVDRVTYELFEDVFKENNGFDIPGKPVALVKAMSKDVGPLGTITIMTDQVSYIINNVDCKKVRELKDEFLDGAPRDLYVTDRHDCEHAYSPPPCTFLTTRDGRIFRRIMTENYLGGKFLTESYYVDEKGYKVVSFGHAEAGKSKVPCYDEKNGRVLTFSFVKEGFGNWWEEGYEEYEAGYISPVKEGSGNMNDMPPVWKMPEGTEVLYLGMAKHLSINGLYTIIYNDRAGNTYIGDFAINSENVCITNAALKVIPFPGGSLNKESQILTRLDYDDNGIIIYTKDKEIRYIDRNRDNSDYDFLSFDAKVTYIGYSKYQFEDYTKLFVGLEDGSILIYDISIRREPKLLEKFKLDGKITAMKELGDVYSGDLY